MTTIGTLIDHLRPLHPDARGNHILQMVRDGLATWISPTTPGVGDSPATHQHEIEIFGIFATGPTGAEAVENWIRIAAQRQEQESAA